MKIWLWYLYAVLGDCGRLSWGQAVSLIRHLTVQMALLLRREFCNESCCQFVVLSLTSYVGYTLQLWEETCGPRVLSTAVNVCRSIRMQYKLSVVSWSSHAVKSSQQCSSCNGNSLLLPFNWARHRVVSLAIPIVRSVLSTFPQQSSQVCVSHSFTEQQSVFCSDSYQWQASQQHSSRLQ